MDVAANESLTKNMEPDAGEPRRLSSGKLSLLALPTGFTDIALLPFAIVIPVFYAKTTGLSLAVIGSILIFTKLLDAITDPVMGIVSDRFETRFGRRKPWVVLGAIFFAFSFYMVFTPDPDDGAFYFAVWVVLMYIGYTIFSVPKYAWHVEVCRSYDERQRVVSYSTAATFIGSLLVMLFPIAMSPITGSTQFNGEVLSAIAIFVVIGLPISAILSVRYVPQEQRLTSRGGNLRDLPSLFKKNRPFVQFVIAFTIWQIGSGIWSGVTFLYVDSYLNMGDIFAVLIICGFTARLLFIPVWIKIAYRLGKHKTFILATLCNTCFIPLLALLAPGEQSLLPILALTIMLNIFDGALFVLPPSILGDTADYDTYLTGLDRVATYKSVVTLVIKAAIAIGTGSGLVLVDLFGYQVGQANSEEAILGLKFVTAFLPAIFFAIAAFTMIGFPLTRERHAEIMEKMAQTAKQTP